MRKSLSGDRPRAYHVAGRRLSADAALDRGCIQFPVPLRADAADYRAAFVAARQERTEQKALDGLVYLLNITSDLASVGR